MQMIGRMILVILFIMLSPCRAGIAAQLKMSLDLFRVAKREQRNFGANARPLRCPMFAYGLLPAALMFSHMVSRSLLAAPEEGHICALVQSASGLNVVLVVPMVMFLDRPQHRISIVGCGLHIGKGIGCTRCREFSERHRNATIWAREQVMLGLNVVSLVPLVMPFPTAQHSIVVVALPGTSVKGMVRVSGFGLPAARHRKVTACARVQMPSGEKWVSSVPLVMPFPLPNPQRPHNDCRWLHPQNTPVWGLPLAFIKMTSMVWVLRTFSKV